MVKAKAADEDRVALERIRATRRRIDQNIDEIYRRSTKAIDPGFIVSHYGPALIAAAFGFGMAFAIGAPSRAREPRTAKANGFNFVLNLLARSLTPALTELLLKRVHMSDAHSTKP